MSEWLVAHAPNQWVQFAAGLVIAAVGAWAFSRWAWGRTFARARVESEALAQREAFKRGARVAALEGRCYVVHAPEIWGGYCEVHKRPVLSGSICDRA